MKFHFGFVLVAAGVIVAGCDKQSSSTPPATNAAPTTAAPASGGNPITAPVDYLGAVVKAQNVAVKKIDVAYIQNAIQLFNAQEGRYPKDLDELVAQKYLGKIPQVPPGTKLQYDAAKGEISVVKQ